MSVNPAFLSVLKPNRPPLWYVTNGELTVGPVITGLLMKGVEQGRVPEYCHVSADSGRWRPLDSVREIAARKRPASTVAEALEALRELERPHERIRDEEELAHRVTHLGMLITRAESGMFHVRRPSSRVFSTRAVLGPMPNGLLNQTLPDRDPVVWSALMGRPVMGPPYGLAEDALAMRFAESEGGVGAAAMIPIFVGPSLLGMLELSRPGHAFRRRDLQRAERIAQRALFQHAS
jgi:hypothetical protein